MAAIWAATAVLWVLLEGNLRLTILFSTLTAFIITGMVVKKCLAGRELSLIAWLTAASLMGLLMGLGSAILTLLFMALKTGLHAHGPEFASLEINWVLQQTLIWPAAGLLGGLGLGILLKAISKPED